ncbi:FAD-binding protein [Helcococcus bovis]|uniref:FAD-binding protein n=1 Tax=Helcococcus bovis TaxID=3153252 RepID=UPI0038B8CFA8
MLYNLKDKYVEYENKIKIWANNFLIENTFSKNILKKLKDDKLFGFHSPKAYGGFGKDYINQVLAIQEISKINPNASFSIISNNFFINGLFKYGNFNQKMKYLSPVDKGELIASILLLEEKYNLDLKKSKTKIVKKEKYLILNGKKYFSYSSKETDLFLVLAKNESGNLTLLVVEKDLSGIEVEKNDKHTYVSFNNVEIPGTNVLGDFNSGYEICISLLIENHLSLAAHYLGISLDSYDKIILALTKIKDLSNNSEILQNFSEISANIEAAKLLTYRAAEMKSNGLDTSKESLLAKSFNEKLAVEIINLEFLLNSDNKELISKLRSKKDINFNNIFNSDLENINLLITDKIIEKIACVDILNKNTNDINIKKRKSIILENNDLEKNVDELINYILDDIKSSKISQDLYGDIESAENIVSFGLGIEDRDNITEIEKLAKIINATIGCTRPISEELEWMPNDRYIGSTGKKFNGNIYFALGLSGSIHHLNGIKNANTIIAINTDRHAKIFSNCDYGIVADLKEFINIFLKKIQEKL